MALIPTRARAAAAALPVLFGLAFDLPAQLQPVPNPMPTRVLDTTWPGVVGSGDFRRVVTGDLFGNQRTSVIALDGTSPKLAFAPASHLSVSTLSATWAVEDIDSLFGGARTRLIGIGGSGLSVGGFDANNVFQVTATGTVSWEGGVMVKAVAYSGSHAVIGLMADRRTLRIGLLTGTGFVNRGSADLGSTVHDVWFADWNSDGTLDVVALTDAGLDIRNLVLGAMTTVANTEPVGAMCVHRRRVQNGGDQVFWVRREPGVTNWRITLWEGGSTVLASDLLLPLAGVTPVLFSLTGIRAADGDLDGYADLMVAQRSTSEVAVVKGLDPGNGYLDLADPILLPLQESDDQPLAGLDAVPAFTDIDRDARADIAVCVEDLTKLRLFVGLQSVLDPPQELGPGDGDIFGDVLAYTPFTPTAGPTGQYPGQQADEFHLLFQIPPAYAGMYPTLEVTLWHQPNPNQPVDSIGYTAQVALPAASEFYVTIPMLTDSATPANPVYLRSDGYWSNRDHFWLEARFVDTSTGDVSPSFVMGMTVMYAQGALDWYLPLANQPDGGERIDMFETGSPPHQAGPRLGGGARPRGRIPATVLDGTPLPGPLVMFLDSLSW